MALQKQIDRDSLHPMRMQSRWPGWADTVRRQARDWGAAIQYEEFESLQKDLRKTYNQALESIAVEKRPKGSQHLLETLERSVRFGMLHRAGFNIFLMSRAMRSAIGRTSLKGVRIGDLRMPFQALYIGFEGGSGVRFVDGSRSWVNDGAYIIEAPLRTDDPTGSRRFEVCLTSRDPVGPMRPEWGEGWAAEREPHIVLHLVGMPEETIEEALGHALANGEIDLEVDEAQVDSIRLSVGGIQEEGALMGTRITTPMETGTEWRARFNNENFAAAHVGLGMALGALVVMVARRDGGDIDQDVWPADAPEDLVKKAELSENPKARRKARGDLLRAGHVTFRHIDFDGSQAETDGAPSVAGGGKRPHWRQGHIRRQPFGPERANYKLVWIHPMLINAGIGAPGGRVTRISRHGD